MGLGSRVGCRPFLALAFIFIIMLLTLLVLYGFGIPKSLEAKVEKLVYIDDDRTVEGSRAAYPPRGWNSYDSFSWIISEEQFLTNAQILSDKLLSFGYQYAVVDFLWYRKHESGASVNSPGYDIIDEWGRPIPDPVRWPSSSGGKGFKQVAEKVHKMGLKFGIHVMRGISAQAVKTNTPIMGPQGVAYEENGKIWRAKDIALNGTRCVWMAECFMSVDTSLRAGRAFIASLYHQYVDWGIDLVKHDCIFGQDLNIDEISLVSQILKDIDRPILYSISPGKDATPDMARKISKLVNMYRITADDWDSWHHIRSHFEVSRDFAASGLIGSQGLLGRSWPDLDMLPFGWLTDIGTQIMYLVSVDSNEGPHRFSKLLPDEQKVQMTLWAMAKSPIMFGGDLRQIDNATMALITNPTILDINANSTLNQELCVDPRSRTFQRIKSLFLKIVSTRVNNVRTWIAKGASGESYIATFNLGDSKVSLHMKIHDIMLFESKLMITKKKNATSCLYFDVWRNQNIEVYNNLLEINVPRHGTNLLVLRCS
ncbi:alpha-galactosidase mel1 isoform X2 [Cryptomeria japonica]|uniref:alpha-galactosidase mel1 isoform X2 n=1 Tax=Cryptomeria japonica TaxID=3369 RepID=UPI0027DA8AE5|nr:alpha-galactosidase mel1 isoform X2 [Cryptomeria japonica]